MAQVLPQLADEQRLPLLAEPDHRVELGARAHRRHRPQELDVARRHLHVDLEVGARGGEEDVDLLAVEQDRVEREPAVRVVQHRDDERQLVVAVDHLAEDVRGLVPVEGRAEHLHLVVRLDVRPRRQLVERREHAVEVGVEVGERARPAEVCEDLLEAGARTALGRVVAAVDRRVGLDRLGRDRRAHEHQVVVRVGAAQDPGRHRVEERLGELRLGVLDQQADVLQLRLAPGLVVERLDVELRAEPLDALADALVVEADPLLHGALLLHPRPPLEPLLRAGAHLPEQAVVPVESLDQDGCDSLSRPTRHPVSHEHTVGQ